MINATLRSRSEESHSEATVPEADTLLLDVRFPKSQWQRHLPFYRLEFARTPAFSSLERQALEDVSGFLGDYLYDRILHAHKHACRDALSRLQRICLQRDRKAGTTVWRYFGKLHKALAAHASFLLFVKDSSSFLTHYYKIPSRGSPAYCGVNAFLPLDPKFLRLCRDEGVFLWSMQSRDDALAPLVHNFLSGEDFRWDCLVSATHHEGDLFALQVFLFRRSYPLFRPLYDDFLKEASLLPQKALEEAYRRRTRQMIVNPIFRGRDFRADEELAFTLMPFTEPWSDRIWARLIKPIVEECGLRAVRADDLYGRDIMEDIWKSLCASRLVIAEITGRNPNVFYELGLAHTIGKPVILLTQDVADIPFDLNRYRHITYEDNLDGYEKLKRELKKSIEDELTGSPTSPST